MFEDVPLFLGLINDLFPGLDCPRVRYPSFNDAVEAVLAENNYVLLDTQVDKVVQMYETMMTRHTTMIVGPTCGGKSVVINTLCQSQGKLNIPTKVHTLNAKGKYLRNKHLKLFRTAGIFVRFVWYFTITLQNRGKILPQNANLSKIFYGPWQGK